jgi:4-hydroxy-2-oxoheptanedioate aldolase
MESVKSFIEKIRRGGVCLGTGITFTDPTATEALCDLFDFVWIDMEHNALSLEAVQGHIMATKASRTLPLVRVPANDPIWIKRVLDIGAAGVIVPMVRTAQEAALAGVPLPAARNSGNWRPPGFELRTLDGDRFLQEYQ